jgi:phage terminase large subunit
MYRKTTAVDKILGCKKRIRVIQGGSSAGKTIAILLCLIDYAGWKKNALISVVSETIPHLKRGAIRDFLSIMEARGYYKESNWNRTDFIYTFETGSRIEFFSADTPDKVRGPRRDILFINEANNVSFETYTQLAIRTNEFIYLDYNPVQQFWVHDEVIPKLDHDFLILTYKDNEGLPEAIVQEIESRRGNKYFWTVYGLGELGEIEGLIYPGWQEVDEIPPEARLERRWLDYGYSNDPTAIGDMYYCNGALYLDEVVYQKGLANKQIADIILNQQRKVPVVADSAEPKSNDELRSYGITVLDADKGKDSVNAGIQLVQDQQIFVTKRSLNIIKERRNYMWLKDKDGKGINEPTPIFNHHMDGIRYAVRSLVPLKRREDFVNSLPVYHRRPRVNQSR